MDPPSLIKCPKCPKLFTTNSNRNRHLRKNICQKSSASFHADPETTPLPNIYVYQCDNCNKLFKQNWHLREHIENEVCSRQLAKEKKMKFQCRYCNNSYSLEKNLMTHIKVKHGKNSRAICEKCCKSFSTKGALTRHLKTCGGDKKDSTKNIPSTVSSSESSNSDSETETQSRDSGFVNPTHKCQLCQKTFSSLGNLRTPPFLGV